MKISDIKNKTYYLLKERRDENIDLEIELFLNHLFGNNYDENRYITESEYNLFHSIYKKLIKKPIQRIIGYTILDGVKLKITEDVLLPGKEMDTLLSVAKKYISNTDKILDIGTGSGVIPILLSSVFLKTKFTAIDISVKALNIAKKNACLQKKKH